MEHLIVRRAINRRDGAQQRHVSINIHKSIRDLSNPYMDPKFQSIHRLTPDLALSVVEEIKPHYPQTSYANAIAPELKFLAALHFYAQGSYQRPDGKDASVSLSQTSVSRAISQTTNALNKPGIIKKWIKFPCELSERQQLVQNNYRRFNIPGVLGYVDGTHIIIKKPAVHEELFINRKGQHSLNVQVVCDSSLIILNILARYPGSTHDAFIWRSSSVRDRMVHFSTNNPCWLLGDSGYPLEPWLLTPVLNADEGSPEATYTKLHIRSRNCIERCFGLLKGRFRCLNKNRTLEYAPKKAGYITNACAVLHNMCIRGGLEEVDLEDAETTSDSEDNPTDHTPASADIYRLGVQVRTDVINRLI